MLCHVINVLLLCLSHWEFPSPRASWTTKVNEAGGMSSFPYADKNVGTCYCFSIKHGCYTRLIPEWKIQPSCARHQKVAWKLISIQPTVFHWGKVIKIKIDNYIRVFKTSEYIYFFYSFYLFNFCVHASWLASVACRSLLVTCKIVMYCWLLLVFNSRL